MSQKNRTWRVRFKDGRVVTVTARGRRMALSKACVETHQSESDIDSYAKQTSSAWGHRLR